MSGTVGSHAVAPSLACGGGVGCGLSGVVLRRLHVRSIRVISPIPAFPRKRGNEHATKVAP